jgi:hypothetical protein
MAAKLAHFAHPQGWNKGEAMRFCASPSGAPAVAPEQSPPVDLLGHCEQTPFLAFTNESYRDQWLRWWRKA